MSFAEFWDILKWRIRKLFPKKLRKLWWGLFILGCLVIIFLQPVLKGVGGYLIVEDELKKSDAIFVLGGNTYDRTNHAAFLYDEGYADKIVTLGANSAIILKSLGMENMSDALIMREQLYDLGVPEDAVWPLVEGTSTKEESEAILQYSLEHQYDQIIVVSDKFHTRRINSTFDEFEKNGVTVIISGAPHSEYDEAFWWQSEQGLIMVNNEYIKLMYYWWNY